jgi:hypothetical protein
MSRHSTDQSDRGMILPMVLVISIVLATVVVGVASYGIATLRYGRVTEGRAHRLAAAQGAMDDAIERLELKRSLCSTLAGSGPQSINPGFPPVNGAEATVTCEVVSDLLPPSDGWAIVITGEGGANPTLDLRNGGNPTIEGPIYTHDISKISLDKPTTLLKGDLWHLDTVCAPGAAGTVAFRPSLITVPQLTFDPSRGTYCTNQTWSDLFNQVPPTQQVATILDAPAPLDDGPLAGTCKLFFPGRYGSKPVLALHNYFQSGDYLFDNIGNLDMAGNQLTMGNIESDKDSAYPLLEANDDDAACKAERLADPNVGGTGATLYLGGNSRITVSNHSDFEISRRRHGNYLVSMQVLASPVLASSTVPIGTAIIASDSGNNKDIAMNGLLWAPYHGISFGTVSAKKDAAIRGGAVVASLIGKISTAGEGGFLIRVPTSEASVELLLVSTALIDGASTTVRVIADWRPTTGQLAVNSWRVVN